MKLTVAGETKEYPNDLTIQDWMDYVDVQNQEVALVQLNGRDVLAGDRAQIKLKDGDHLQLLYFLGDS